MSENLSVENEMSEPQDRPSWWRRLRRWLAGPPRTDAPGRYVPRAPVTTFVSPSKGDAYDFSVRIRWVWKGGRWDDTDLGDSVEPVKADVWEKLTVATRCILRSYPPHQPEAAETALNRRFEEIMRSGQVSGTSAKWTARAEVSPHETIRTQQQEAWSQRLRWAADHEMATIIVHDYAVMVGKWRELLAEVGIGETSSLPPAFIGRYLIRLATDPSDAAGVVDALSDRREAKDRELLHTVADAVQGHDNLNLLETDIAYDSALRRLMDWAGLPLPELTERPWSMEEDQL